MTNVNAHLTPASMAGWLHKTTLFSALAESDLHCLASGAQCLQLTHGQALFQEGVAANHYFLVLQGKIEVFRYSLDGEDRVFSVFGAQQLVAIAAMFMAHGRYPMNARCQDDARVIRLAKQPLMDVCLRNATLGLQILRLMGATVYQHVNEVEWLTTSSAPQRLALYLMRLCEQQGSSIELPLSQRQLASRLGVRAETLSRLLSDWQAHGHVLGRGREWKIQNHQYLKQLTDGAQRTF